MKEYNCPKCPECDQYIDPYTCYCGAAIKDHGYFDNHSGIPIGCICGYATKPVIVKETKDEPI
tara:strand:- start:57076 stop:57264 length:189 start_codon:yes stop_codon:yes gene_type:complete